MVFTTTSAVRKALQQHKAFIKAFYGPGFYTTKNAIIRESVESNTYRAFQNKPKKGIKYANTPSSIFRSWAQSVFFVKYFPRVGKIKNERSFSALHEEIVANLSAYWKKEGKCTKELETAYSCKLVDLLFKFLPRCNKLSNKQRIKLISLIYVPLDSYTLKAIRYLWNEQKNLDLNRRIPSSPGMGLVENDYDYYFDIQNLIRNMMKEQKSPPIYFDLISFRKSEEAEEAFTLIPKKGKE